MKDPKEKLVQYLNEAEAMEQALVSTLRAHTAMTPRGQYRTDLERHLDVTRRHAKLVRDRAARIGSGFNPVAMATGLVQMMAGQVLALGKAPLDMVRGMSLEEKLLKNAKDECATESLEIATYTAIEALARKAGDTETAELAVRIRRDEEQMLQGLLRHLPKLSLAVAGAEIDGEPQLDITTVGAADQARRAVRRTRRTATQASRTTRRTATRTARTAKRTAGTAVRRAEGAARRTQRTATTTAASTQRAATGAVSRGAGRVERTARTTRRKAAATNAAANREPWRGYDEQTADQVASRVVQLPEERKERVREYESDHKDRSTVIEAAQSSS